MYKNDLALSNLQWLLCHETKPKQNQSGQSKTEQCSHGLNRKMLTLWSENLDNRMFENLQNIRQSHKLPHENHEKLKNRISSRRTNHSKGENL